MFAQENVLENIIRETEVIDFESDVVDDFLHFLYSDEVMDPALYNSVDLLLMADKYNVEDLRKECEKALVKSISIFTAIPFLSTASRIQAPLLVARSANFIFKNLDILVKSDDWKDMVKSYPEAMDHIFQNRFA
jgi:speckle-type POZ protein